MSGGFHAEATAIDVDLCHDVIVGDASDLASGNRILLLHCVGDLAHLFICLSVDACSRGATSQHPNRCNDG
ncbi:MAG: hypothetical protein IPG46_10115 [Actinobacteria bacterium]|nr:hypothetical protein [Actinomycetota bacterium]